MEERKPPLPHPPPAIDYDDCVPFSYRQIHWYAGEMKPCWIQIVMGHQTSSHVRLGLEDNIYYRRGEKATSNAQLVERAVPIAHELNREVATPVRAREMLGMPSKPSQYEPPARPRR